jgi:hypothetical protein
MTVSDTAQRNARHSKLADVGSPVAANLAHTVRMPGGERILVCGEHPRGRF